MARFTCLLIALFLPFCISDTPANCSYEDIRGNWIFYESERSQTSGENCQKMGAVVFKLHVDLTFPNVAVDEFGNVGYWTIIYNQGFEVVINERKYFAFSFFKQTGQNVTSYCDRTFPGWSHDILVRNWACFTASKVKSLLPKRHVEQIPPLNQMYTADKALIYKINRQKFSWKAKIYRQFEGLSTEELTRMKGGRKSALHEFPKTAPITNEHKKLVDELPAAFDWRNVNGISYVSPIRNQGTCGSCFAFASMAMLEARLRIYTNNTNQDIFSPQDVVSCSEYSQGCDGGFPYLIAGKYAQDFGVVPEKCFPYTGQNDKCVDEKKCLRTYVSKYNYVGGFYGGCNEALMRYSLVHHGPVAVGFEVYNDFMHYSSGIYHHTGLNGRYNPFELTNHAVLVVGYGEEGGQPYWTVKNSWGTEWGENGFFRIRRGNDECAIESLGMEAFPIP